MTQQEFNEDNLRVSVWRYLGNQMVKEFRTAETTAIFRWYEDGLHFYETLFKIDE